MFHRTVRCLAVLTLLAGMGCASTLADPTGRQTALENAQRRYTQLVRWGEIKRASVYVEPDLREEFLSYEPFFEQIRFTDTETLVWDPEKSTGKYNLYRDVMSALSGGDYGQCEQHDLPDETTTDSDAPPVGGGYFYLVTAVNRLGEEGNKGLDSSGEPRPNPDACP